MKRRGFLAMLGLAPATAKVAPSSAIAGRDRVLIKEAGSLAYSDAMVRAQVQMMADRIAKSVAFRERWPASFKTAGMQEPIDLDGTDEHCQCDLCRWTEPDED